MRVDFWGVRGTVVASGKDRVKYGGHTICSSLSISDKEVIVIDAGTGIKKLGDKLIEKIGKGPFHIYLLLTHFHLDHITGLPFFAPLYSPHAVLTVYAPSSPQESQNYLEKIMSGRFFPIDFEETPSRKFFKKIPEHGFKIGQVFISACPLHHPQGSVAYRLQKGEQSLVLATDTEHPEKGMDKRLASFVNQTDVLVYDAMFTPEEYESGRKGWGHSTWLAGTEIAQAAGVQSLYLSHFNPNHSDKIIDASIALSKDKFPRTFGAREGQSVIF